MAKTVDATVLEAFEWNGQAHYPGDTIPALPIVDALVLLRKKAISFDLTRRKPTALPAEPPVKRPVARSRRRYRRSDMQPETPSATAPLMVEEEADDPIIPLAQDITADDEES